MMRYLIFTLYIGLLVLLFAFREKHNDKIGNNLVVTTTDPVVETNNHEIERIVIDTAASKTTSQAMDFVEYAKTLMGTPYLYGSVDPSKGLDCSGFINAVAKHFGVKVPRSSVEFTNAGTTVKVEAAQPGDLVLFTGTDPNSHTVGHLGMITNNVNGQINFIHSSSGKAKGVTISELDEHYQKRFVKVIRIFATAGKVIV